jgi:hypothetical protein
MNGVTLPLGSISLIDKIEKDYGLISSILGKADKLKERAYGNKA